MIEKIQIPDTDLVVSPIGLGTVNAGTAWDGEEGFAILEEYIKMGGNLIDTARVYSDWIPGEIGRSERVIGDWIAHRGHHDDFVLITKGGHPPHEDTSISRMTKADMEHDLELSLKALRVDCIDVYMYHRDDTNQSVADLIEVMQEFVNQGKIRYYGCSNWSVSRMEEAMAYCKQKGYRGFVMNEMFYNIASDTMSEPEDPTLAIMDQEMIRFHKNYPVLAVPYFSVCSGFFHKLINKGPETVQDSPYYTPANLELAKKIQGIAVRHNASISQVLLGFYFQQGFPVCPLTGVHSTAQLKDAMGTLNVEFTPEEFAK